MNGQSYPEVAARAVASAYQQHPSPVFGYLRSGYQQKIYLYNALEDARGWFTALAHGQQPFDYAAVFVAPEFSHPVQGLESFGHTNVSGDPYVGNWVPFLLGLPLGGLAGYFLRSWQEGHPGQALPGIPPGTIPPPKIPAGPGAPPPAPSPKTSGDPYGYAVGCGDMVGGPWVDMVGPQVGGPWVDMVGPQVGGPWVDMVGPQVGGPWVDMVGPQVGGPWVDMVGLSPAEQAEFARAQAELLQRARTPGGWGMTRTRLAQSQARSLIQSAIDDVTSQASNYPAEAWVWSLSAPGPSYGGSVPESSVTLSPQSIIAPFSSRAQALDYLRQVAQTRPLATAMFERSFRWPNPTAWHKSDEPEHEAMIAEYLASRGGATRTAGIGAWHPDFAQAVDRLVDQHYNFWGRQPGTGSGAGSDWFLHRWMPFYNQFQSKLVSTFKDALRELVTLRQEASQLGLPLPPLGSSQLEMAVQQARIDGDYVGAWGTAVGAVIDDVRERAKSIANKRAGNVVGVIHTSKDGNWHALAFRNEDDADDWITLATQNPSTYTYAAYFDKQDATWPNPVIENVSGMRAPPGTALPRKSVSGGDMIGATGPARAALEGLREHARQLATSNTPRGSEAAGVIRTTDGLWHALGFKSLDDSIDWLQAATREKASFVYAAAFEKASDGSAYFQAEEVGEQRSPAQARETIHRDVATTSGDDYGYSVGGPWVDLYGWAA